MVLKFEIPDAKTKFSVVFTVFLIKGYVQNPEVATVELAGVCLERLPTIIFLHET